MLAGAAAAVAIVALGRDATFYHDEWALIDRREAWTLDALLQPHNEHLSLGLAVLYKAIFEFVGMRSYIPYLAVLAMLHVLVAGAIASLAARHNGWALALPLALLMLLLGSGSENLYWAMQIGFVGSTASGLWALIAQERGRWAMASILLLISVVTGGIGLSFVVAAAVLAAASRTRVRLGLAVLLPAVVAYGAWFVAIGRGAVATHREPFTLQALAGVPSYVVAGVSHAVGAVSGLGPGVGLVVAVLGAALLIGHGLRQRVVPRVPLAAVAGLLFSYALFGLVRAQLGLEQATASRYVYVAGAFLLAALGSLPMRHIAARRATAIIGGGALLLACALTMNLAALAGGHAYFDDQARRTRAVASIVQRFADAPGIDHERVISPQPAPGRFRELMRRHGGITGDQWFPEIAAAPTADELDEALWRVAGPDFMLAPAELVEALPSAVQPVLGELRNATKEAADGGCLALVATGEPSSVALRLDDGEALAYRGDGAGTLTVWVARLAGFTGDRALHAIVDAGSWSILRAPDLAEPASSWQLRLQPPAGVERWRLCVLVDR